MFIFLKVRYENQRHIWSMKCEKIVPRTQRHVVLSVQNTEIEATFLNEQIINFDKHFA